MADLLGSILSSMEKPPSLGDQESRRKARGEDPKLTSAFLHPVLRSATLSSRGGAASSTLKDPSQAPSETPQSLQGLPAYPPAVGSGR